jgi:hypothetical protein
MRLLNLGCGMKEPEKKVLEELKEKWRKNDFEEMKHQRYFCTWDYLDGVQSWPVGMVTPPVI